MIAHLQAAIKRMGLLFALGCPRQLKCEQEQDGA